MSAQHPGATRVVGVGCDRSTGVKSEMLANTRGWNRRKGEEDAQTFRLILSHGQREPAIVQPGLQGACSPLSDTLLNALK